MSTYNIDKDYNLWLEEQVYYLRGDRYEDLDKEHLIEELESLGISQRSQLRNRLVTLYEHQLKRAYVPLPDCYRGWEKTISRTEEAIEDIYLDSPSLRNYAEKIKGDCYERALRRVRQDYPSFNFPDSLD